MANSTAGNPFIIDTATATAIYTDRFQLLAIQWVSGSVADVCSVQDGAGVVKWEVIQPVTNTPQGMAFPDELELTFNGLKVPTMNTGKVYLYVKRT